MFWYPNKILDMQKLLKTKLFLTSKFFSFIFGILPPSPKLNFTFGCTDFLNMSGCITWQLVTVRDQVVTKCFCKRCVVDPDLRKIFPQKSAIKIFESPPTPSPYTMLWATGVTKIKMRGTKRSKRTQHCIREGGGANKKKQKPKKNNKNHINNTKVHIKSN